MPSSVVLRATISFTQVLQSLLYEGDAHNPLGERAPPWARLAMQSDTEEEAMAAVQLEAPHVFLLHRATIKKSIGEVMKSKKRKLTAR